MCGFPSFHIYKVNRKRMLKTQSIIMLNELACLSFFHPFHSVFLLLKLFSPSASCHLNPHLILFCFILLYFETRFHYVAPNGLELIILLPNSSQCQNFRSFFLSVFILHLATQADPCSPVIWPTSEAQQIATQKILVQLINQ